MLFLPKTNGAKLWGGINVNFVSIMWVMCRQVLIYKHFWLPNERTSWWSLCRSDESELSLYSRAMCIRVGCRCRMSSFTTHSLMACVAPRTINCNNNKNNDDDNNNNNNNNNNNIIIHHSWVGSWNHLIQLLAPVYSAWDYCWYGSAEEIIQCSSPWCTMRSGHRRVLPAVTLGYPLKYCTNYFFPRQGYVFT